MLRARTPREVYKAEYRQCALSLKKAQEALWDLLEELDNGRDEYRDEDPDQFKAYDTAYDEIEEISTNLGIMIDESKQLFDEVINE